MDSILSMILSKDGNQTYIELATITVFAGHTINLLVQDGATADGFVNQGGESYLHLHWDNPTLQQAGLYKCSVEGLDALGHNIALHIITQVTDKQPDIVDVVSEVSAIREYVKDLESKYSALNNYTHTLEQKMFAMDAYTTVLQQKVSALENERLTRMSDLFEFPPLEYNHRKYYISKEEFYHIEAAMTMCYIYGGYLVEIHDENEYRAIQGYLQNITDFSLLSIAGTDEGHDGQWVLQSTNKSCPYLNWYSNSSNAAFGTSNSCLTLSQSYSWRMYDYQCHRDVPFYRRRYMCEVVFS